MPAETLPVTDTKPVANGGATPTNAAAPTDVGDASPGGQDASTEKVDEPAAATEEAAPAPVADEPAAPKSDEAAAEPAAEEHQKVQFRRTFTVRWFLL